MTDVVPGYFAFDGVERRQLSLRGNFPCNAVEETYEEAPAVGALCVGPGRIIRRGYAARGYAAELGGVEVTDEQPLAFTHSAYCLPHFQRSS